MNTKATGERSGEGQSETSSYTLSATLDKYELKEISLSQMSTYLRKIGQKSFTPIPSSGGVSGKDSLRIVPSSRDRSA